MTEKQYGHMIKGNHTEGRVLNSETWEEGEDDQRQEGNRGFES